MILCTEVNWDVGVDVVFDDVNIVADNVSIVDIVVVEIDGHNVLTVLLMLLILWEDWSFEKTWLSDCLTDKR